MTQKTDNVVTRKSDMEGVRALVLTLRKRYLLTYPVESANRMFEKGFKVTINHNEF